jgi:hypothetical protein
MRGGMKNALGVALLKTTPAKEPPLLLSNYLMSNYSDN